MYRTYLKVFKIDRINNEVLNFKNTFLKKFCNRSTKQLFLISLFSIMNNSI